MEDKQYQIDLLTAMNEKLMSSEHMYRLACEFSGAAYIYFDLKNDKTELFGAWEELTGVNLQRQPYDRNFMLTLVNDDDQKMLLDYIYKAVRKDEEEDSVDFRAKHSNRWIRAKCIQYKDADNNVTERLVSFEDITRSRKKTEEIEYYAYHDVLTGLYNRNQFFTLLRDMLEKADKEKTSVELMLVDIDNFKKINDSLGLVYGDELVQTLAIYIDSLSSDNIIVGRYGSDVYSVAIYDPCGKNCSDMIFKAIRDRLKRPIILTNKAEVSITVSAGVCEYPGGGRDALELIKNAEIVLYVSKQNDKGSISFYNDDILKNYDAEIILENKLDEAIRNEGLDVYFQPLYDAASGKIRGAEALVRWLKDDNSQLYSPAQFIPIAEKNGSIIDIGNFVFREVFKAIREWEIKYRTKYIISVNVSSVQLAKPDFIDNLQKLMELYEVSPEYLELEITESVLINDFDDTIDTLRLLNQLGIKVSMDDFGTGFSSLNYLRQLPISTLKIDKSFIDDICIDEKTAHITSSVVDMVKKLSLETVAEGVENDEQADLLREIGCDNLQGYLFSKPVSKSEFEKIIIRQMP